MLDIKKELESFELKFIDFDEEDSKTNRKDEKTTEKTIKKILMAVTESTNKDDEIKELKKEITVLKKEKVSIAKKIIKILDSFESITDFAKQSKNEKFIKNLKIIEKDIKQALRSVEFEEIPTVGEKFDAEIHEAVLSKKDDTKMRYEVIEVLEKGYKFNGKVLRIAKVIAVE